VERSRAALAVVTSRLHSESPTARKDGEKWGTPAACIILRDPFLTGKDSYESCER